MIGLLTFATAAMTVPNLPKRWDVAAALGAMLNSQCEGETEATTDCGTHPIEPEVRGVKCVPFPDFIAKCTYKVRTTNSMVPGQFSAWRRETNSFKFVPRSKIWSVMLDSRL